ncbi:beta-defensin 105-like [Hipposideros larvatus]
MEHRNGFSLLIHFTDQEHITLLSNISEPLVLSKPPQTSVLKGLPSATVPSRKMLYFVFVFFFILAQFPSGCHAGFKNNQEFQEVIALLTPLGANCREALPKNAPRAGEFASCETCWLGRGRCKKICAENEKVFGPCKPSYFCCRRRL